MKRYLKQTYIFLERIFVYIVNNIFLIFIFQVEEAVAVLSAHKTTPE